MRCSHCATEMRRTRHEQDRASQVAWYRCPACRSTTMSSAPRMEPLAGVVRVPAAARGRP